ncbi:ATP-binding cassette domain-containing protein [Natronorubrum texcoconense]|uniref:ABC-type branched-chain amino acid transport system, ATPase component n=1 Tax=Natronorubrum texcoconense TaxID=1095776 RepID=A0A1G9D359_9EURY|nr:ATP-binding cassette domain-containing protein [Natronorubrum texcoconense]SDK58095.1 ABC-type branched-chain amino acid transport system, ATPase component [Natronorubrum texcoconense]
MSDYILETADLRKTFGELVANDGISLGVERGEVHGIIGPNGSGKSTFFNTVTGFLEPNGGTVRFEGEDVTNLGPDEIARAGLGRTFQIASPFTDLTVRENLLSVYTAGLGSGLRIPDEKRARAQNILEQLEIEHIAEHEASDISGGQQQLLELGRILMLDPSCIMLDEPTAGVNPALQARIIDHLQGLNDEGRTFVIIEHDMSVISGLTDRVSVLNQGQIVMQGDFDSVTSDERVREAYLGETTDPDAGLDDTLEGSRSASDATADTVADGSPETAGSGGTSATSGGTSAANASASAQLSVPTGDTDSRQKQLVADNIVTGYGNHTVIEDVSVESHEGITCIFGPNGSGKSTLLKALIGAVPVWSGSIRYGDTDITQSNTYKNLDYGMVMLPQDGGIFGNLTVKENLLLGGYRVNDRSVRRDRLDDVLAAFPALEEKLDADGGSLSGGQQMMLSFGRAMMTGSELFLLDEPSAGLAPSLVDDVFEMTETLVNQGAQVILVEQNVREALRIADHVYILAQGQLQFEGPAQELLNEDELVELYLGLE